MEGVVASAVNENGEELYPRKWNFDFADMPVIANQHTPSLTGEEITALVAAMQGQERMLGILIATSGLRIGELSALQVNHFVENALRVEQTVWHGRVRKRKGKSQNFLREVDLHSSVATMLREFIGERKDGFIFPDAQRYSHQSIQLPSERLAPRTERAWNREAGLSRFPALSGHSP